MATLSVIIITNNEEKNLTRALESVKFADEFVVCDSGSTDSTLEIARSYNCKIVYSEFRGFGAAKQSALDNATGDWILSIDADEEVSESLQAAIKSVLNAGEYDAYYLNRKSKFLGKWISHSGWYPDWILRMFRREKSRFDQQLVHEGVHVDGKTGKLQGLLLHYTDPDISHYLSKMDRYTTLSAQTLVSEERRFHVSDLIFKPTAIFIKMFFLKLGFLDGVHGLALASLSSFHVLCKYAKLWELQRR
jgi:hypothetical protein